MDGSGSLNDQPSRRVRRELAFRKNALEATVCEELIYVLGHQAFVKTNQEGEGGRVEGSIRQTREDGVLYVAVIHSADFAGLPAGNFEDRQWQKLLVDCG